MLRRPFRGRTYPDSYYSHPNSQMAVAHGRMKRLGLVTPRTPLPVSLMMDAIAAVATKGCSYYRHLRTVAKTAG